MAPWIAAPLTWVAVALAGAVPSTQPVSFDQAIGFAAEAPDVQGAQRAVGAQRALAGSISSLDANPQILLQPGMRVAPWENRGFELQASLMQSWNLAGLSGARRDAARAEGRALEAQARAKALSQRLSAARAWIDLWGAQALLEVGRREVTTAGELLKLVERAAAAEASTRADVADARAYLAEARLSVIAAEGEVVERGLLLGREMAAGGGEGLLAAGDLPAPTLPAPGSWVGLIQRAGRLHTVEARALEARAEKARLVEARAARGTQLSLGVQVQRDQPGGLVLFGLAGVTLPAFDRGERERSAVAARVATAEGEAARAVLDARAEMRMALHEVEHTGDVLAAIRDDLLPAVEDGVAARDKLYRAENATLPELLLVKRQALATRGRLIRAQAQASWARVKAWLLVAALEESAEAAQRRGAPGAAR
ncbi:TolC family protein [Chondromyces crocatus]|uniref:Metal transporter n=1 Tax=Chondromyces crocatus TaxID=52 RepID=A0A0K1EQH1_CHOCO|nr:TolC family protein [Chondromyces crocatus]AKT43076.1 metal transporter [Chondromyces crocatus]